MVTAVVTGCYTVSCTAAYRRAYRRGPIKPYVRVYLLYGPPVWAEPPPRAARGLGLVLQLVGDSYRWLRLLLIPILTGVVRVVLPPSFLP